MSYEKCGKCERFFENRGYPKPVQWWEVRIGLVEHPLQEEAVIQVQLCEECVNGLIRAINQYLKQDMTVHSITTRMSQEQVMEMEERNRNIRVREMAKGLFEIQPSIDDETADIIEQKDVDEVVEILGYDPILRFPKAYTKEEIALRNKNIRDRERWQTIYRSPKIDDIAGMIEIEKAGMNGEAV